MVRATNLKTRQKTFEEIAKILNVVSKSYLIFLNRWSRVNRFENALVKNATRMLSRNHRFLNALACWSFFKNDQKTENSISKSVIVMSLDRYLWTKFDENNHKNMRTLYSIYVKPKFSIIVTRYGTKGVRKVIPLSEYLEN